MAIFHDTTTLSEMPRPVIEAEIERLIAMLDDMDPDAEAEDAGDDEPWLGAPEAQTGSWRGLERTGNDDREHDTADDEDGCDAEPGCEDEGGQCEDEGAGDLFASANLSGPCSPIASLLTGGRHG